MQLSVHSSGRPAPVASQKGQMAPLGSRIGCGATPNTVPEVPRDTTSWPGSTTPAPSALIALSPEPGETERPGGRPSEVAADGCRCPMA